MTYREDFTLPAELMEQVQEQGLEILPELIRIIINAAMLAERGEHLNAGHYQHTSERQGYANGFKPKTMRTRVGDITFAVPQVREGGFYPQALEKGLRSERALTLALAEMYVQGVSTRKVKAITEQLCGVDVSSSQVSRAAAQMDSELAKWRERPWANIHPVPGCVLRAGPRRWAGAPSGSSGGCRSHSGWKTRDLGRFRVAGRARNPLAGLPGEPEETRAGRRAVDYQR